MGAYSKLHNYTARGLRNNLPNLRIMENYHPDWLLSPVGTRLELDIFLPEINTAIEIQGAQHFSFTSFFHKSYSDFERQKEYDEEKRNLCYGAGIKLVEICTEKDADIFIESISPRETETYYYQEQEISNRKFKKVFKFTDPAIIENRIQRSKEKLERFERGELSASEEKVSEWRKNIYG